MRLTIALIGFIGILTGPWWMPLVCMVLLSLRWAALEAVFMGIFMDFIWQGSGAPAASWHTWPLFTLFALALLWASEPLRRHLIL